MKLEMTETITEVTLEGMLRSLAELYLSSENYPLKVMGFFDVPNFEYSNVIESKEELRGRIKVLAQILGKKEITIKNGSGFTFSGTIQIFGRNF